MDILTDLNRRLHGLREHEHLTVSCVHLKTWRDEIKRLREFEPHEPSFPMSMFRDVKYRIVECIHRAGGRGKTSQDVFDYVYANDPNGGPDSGVKIIAVHVCRINKMLAPHKICIRHTQIGRGGYAGVYRMEKAA
jgi:hypothetical protein